MENSIFTLQNSYCTYPGTYESLGDLLDNSLNDLSPFELSCCTIMKGWIAVERKKSEAGVYREVSRTPLTLRFNENNKPYFINYKL